MTVYSRVAPEEHRRSHPRLRLGIPARLETLHSTLQVDLLDLSRTGAKVDLAHFEPVRTAVLHWLSFEAIGDIVWQEGELLGITFDQPLAAHVLIFTREQAPAVVGDAGASEAARAWATGVYREAATTPRRSI